MSALEQALRQIDDQRQNVPKAQGAPTMMALTTEPLLVHTLLRWLPGLVLFLVIVTASGAGYWMHRAGGVQAALVLRSKDTAANANERTEPPSPQSSNTPEGAFEPANRLPVSPAPPPVAQDNDSLMQLANESVFKQPDGFEQATAAWTSGRYATAAHLWLDTLRRQPPSTMALLLAELQTPEQVNNVVLAKATALPWLVIPGSATGSGQWTVLVLTPPADLDRMHAWLSRAGSPALQWGTVAHWVARSEAASMPRAWPSPPAPATAATRATVPTAGVQTATETPAPSTPAPPMARPSAAIPAKTASGQAPTNEGGAAAPAPNAEAPQISRSTATETSATPDNGVPSASRSIESEFTAVEQDLAAARYDAALRRVGQLETTIGSNWRTRYLTGVALSGLQRWQEAVPMLKLARQGNTAHARVALYLSVAQQELGQHEAAIETLTQAQGPHAGMPELWLNKAHSLQALSRGEEAAFHYRRFLELSSNRQDLSQQRAWVQKLLDQKASAW